MIPEYKDNYYGSLNVYRLSEPIQFDRNELSGKPEFRQFVSNPAKPPPPVTKETLQEAYNQIMESESNLSHLLSMAQMQLEEKTEMFEQAVEFGEQLHIEVESLRERLGKELDTICILRRELKTEKEKNQILSSVISEFRDNEKHAKNLELEAHNMKAKLAEQKELSKQEKDEWRKTQMSASHAVNVEIDELRQEVEKERDQRLAVVKELSFVQRRLNDMAKDHKEALTKQKAAEASIKTLQENETNYSSMLLQVSAEKGNLEIGYKELFNQYKLVQEELTELKMMQEQSPSPSAEKLRDSRRCMLPLSDQFYSERPAVNDENAISQYLHITATAVKLHYPDMEIDSEKLINKVKHSPFYLYYDLMMQFMRSKRQKKNQALETVRELERRSVREDSKKTNELPVKPQPSLLSRFFRLKQKKVNADQNSKTERQKSVVAPRMSQSSVSSEDTQLTLPKGVGRQGSQAYRL